MGSWRWQGRSTVCGIGRWASTGGKAWKEGRVGLTSSVLPRAVRSRPLAGQPLGYDILGPTENIQSITKEDLLTYRRNNLTADKMVFAGAGAIDHEQLVELAQKHLSSFPTGPDPLQRSKTSKPEFVGSEVRVRDDTWDDCHIAIAVEGVPASSPDYWTMVSRTDSLSLSLSPSQADLSSSPPNIRTSSPR